ncbi:MAG TPA: DUF5683 domain-containing protein [Rubricoccaceae bacterium]
MTRALRGALAGLALLAGALGAHAQPAAPDTLGAAADSAQAPARALRRSLLLPGWGQATNGQRAKVPVIAAALAGTAAVFVFQQRRYVRYRRSALVAGCRESPDREPCTDISVAATEAWEATGQPTFAQASTVRNQARGRRDLSVLGIGVVYALQALDAYVAAQLLEFDVSEDVAVRVVPGGVALGVRL